jgi:TRAP-type C4-dicarboxylate transport system permease large subunit
MGTVHAYAVQRGYPTNPRATLQELGAAFKTSFFALMTPGVIIGGKVFGWFIATESAAIAVVCASVLSLIVYREMDLRCLKAALPNTGKLAGVTLFCVGAASAFGWLMAYCKMPQAILSGVSSWRMGFIETGFFNAALFLVVGCFLDARQALRTP